MSKLKQVSIRLEPELYEWLKEQVKRVKPETTMNKYINYLVEQDKEKNK